MIDKYNQYAVFVGAAKILKGCASNEFRPRFTLRGFQEVAIHVEETIEF
jgi:hypothetical protein